MSRFRKLLVPIDFSEHAAAALDAALALAKAAQGSVLLVHSYEIPLGTIPPYGVAVPQELMLGVRDAAARRLEKAADKARAAGVPCESHVAHGPAASTIAETAQQLGADLIVMGTRGLTGVKHALLGSVAERVVRIAPCPVLTLKSDANAFRELRRILAPTDFSEHASRALDLAIELARDHNASIHLLHANVILRVAYGVAVPQSVWDGVQEAAAQQLAEWVERVKAAGVPVTSQATTGSAADAIADAATVERADAIVMATRGLTGVKHMLLGSVAERTLRLAPCPVLTVRT